MTDDNVILPEEFDLFAENLQKYQVIDIGSNRWIESHEILLKLNQQAILEASTYREELVKELLVLGEKLPILVHEAFCILIWRIRILPKIFEINENPGATFMLYTALYHEAIAISLLEIVLYHENGCVSLGESALDLVDYCAQAVTQLIGLVNIGHFREEASTTTDATGGPRTAMSELERQQRDLLYAIGMRCLTILSYLADKIAALPLSVARRMVQTHDIPCLLSEILHCQPWQRHINRFEKYINEKWTTVHGSDILRVTKTEAQTWFCMRQLLCNRNVMQNYEINEFRQRELAKCQALLTVHVLDQLPALADLKHHLCALTVTGQRDKSGGGIFLEEVPQIRDGLLAAAKNHGFKFIARKQYEEHLDLDHSGIVAMAKRLNDAYNTDFLARMDEMADGGGNAADTKQEKRRPAGDEEGVPDRTFCGKCSSDAVKKCANCEKVYYCTRECQVKHWPVHREHCHRPTVN